MMSRPLSFTRTMSILGSVTARTCFTYAKGFYMHDHGGNPFHGSGRGIVRHVRVEDDLAERYETYLLCNVSNKAE